MCFWWIGAIELREEMSMHAEGRKLIDTTLDIALNTENDASAEHHLQAVSAMLKFAMVVGQLSPQELANEMLMIDLTRHRRLYR